MFMRLTLRPAVLLVALTVFANAAAGQKIYIITDLEGASGVYHFGQTREKGSEANLRACEYLMGDIAAVVRGLRDGGAEEILILDGHGNQAFVPERLVYHHGRLQELVDPAVARAVLRLLRERTNAELRCIEITGANRRQRKFGSLPTNRTRLAGS